MLSTIIGTFDWPATVVVVGAAMALAIAFSAWLARTPVELQKMKMQNDRDIALANTAMNREVNMAKMQQNLITSHRATDE